MSNLENLKEIFFLFAKDGSDGAPGITINEFRFVVKELGFDIKENELQMMFEEAAGEREESGMEKVLLFDEFYQAMSKLMAKKDSYEAVMNGFKHLDKEGKGYLDVRYFRYLMNQYGEKMPLEDIQEIIKLADPEQTGKIKYDDLVDTMFGKEKPKPPEDPKKKKDSKKGGKKK
jgi:Ca2+-binding protein (EF-Hand superfamily)